MATELAFRRGTTAENNAFTGAAGEITVDTTLDELRLHDGVTPGGKRFVAPVGTTFTPTVTFETAGDLSVSYATQFGRMVKIGDLYFVVIALVFTPTFTTAAGSLVINGIPSAVTSPSVLTTIPVASTGGIDLANFSTHLRFSSGVVAIRESRSGTTGISKGVDDFTSGSAATINAQGFIIP